MNSGPSEALHVLVLPSWFPDQQNPRSGSFFVDQARALQQAGHRVGVIYPEPRVLGRRVSAVRGAPDTQSLEVMRGRAAYVSKAGPLNALAFAVEALRLYRAYQTKHGRPDVIHAQSAAWAGLGAALIRRAYTVPVVLTEHLSWLLTGRMSAWRRTLMLLGLKQADVVLAVSHALAESLTELGLERPVAVLPNTVDTSFFRPDAGARGARELVVLSVGNLLQNKRMDRVVRAFARACRCDATLRLELGGDGPERRPLERLAAELGVSERVTFLGSLDRAQVRAAMQRASLFVLTSEHETFGVVLIEALACGVPVIATRSGGPEDFVTEQVGYLVNHNDEAGLARAMLEAGSRMRQEAVRWGALCRSHVEEHFSYHAFGARLGEVLRRAAANATR